MMKKLFLFLFVISTLSACSSLEHIGTPNQYVEPTDGDIAYVRFITNPKNKGLYPETDCVSGSILTKGMFAPFSGNKMFSHYAVVNVKENFTPARFKAPKRVIDLGLPKPSNWTSKIKDEYDYAEVKVRAGKPTTLVVADMPDGKSCPALITFVPQKDKNYEMTHKVVKYTSYERQCATKVEEFGLDENGQYYSRPIAIEKPKSCKNAQ